MGNVTSPYKRTKYSATAVEKKAITIILELRISQSVYDRISRLLLSALKNNERYIKLCRFHGPFSHCR